MEATRGGFAILLVVVLTIPSLFLIHVLTPKPSAEVRLEAIEGPVLADLPEASEDFWWYQVELEAGGEVVLHLDEPLVKQAVLLADPEGMVLEKWTREEPRNRAGVVTRRPSLSVPSRTEDWTAWLAVEAPYAMGIPVSAWSGVGCFVESKFWHRSFVGVYVGVLTAILALNLVVFLTLRDRGYRDYCMFLGMHLVSLVAYEELLLQTVLGDDLGESALLRVSVPLSLVFLLSFSRRFLGYEEEAGKSGLWLRILQGLFVACTAQVFFVGLPAVWQGILTTQSVLLLVAILSLLLIGGWRAREGRIEHIIFALAFVPHGVAAALFAVGQMNVIERNPAQYYQLLTGSLLEMVLLTGVVAISVRRLVSSREEAQSEAIRQLERRKEVESRYREELESTVARRTSELAEANREKDRLLSILAHDLRSPVNSIVRYCELVQRQKEPPTAGEWREVLENIRESGRSLYGLLENLLTWAQYNWRGLDPHPVLLDLTELLARQERMLVGELRRRSVEIVWERIGGETTAYADPNLVQTIVRNVFTNALAASPACSKIQAVLSHENRMVTLEVRNPGTPIQEEVLAEAEHGGGSSRPRLGLVLCRELTSLCGGVFSVQPVPGYGTAATITLPAGNADNE